MILYHTSTLEIQKPNLIYSRPYLDFGKGFYLTSLLSQAQLYGERFRRRGESAVLNTFILDDFCEDCSRKIFPAYDGEWLDSVTACRKGLSHIEYDIIEGGIADDQVFDTVDLYFSGIYTKEQALDQLKYKKPNHQICIASQEVLDKYLHFQSSEIL